MRETCKRIMILVMAVLTICMISATAFASTKTKAKVGVTIYDSKTGYSTIYYVKKGEKLTVKQLKKAEKKANTWLVEYCNRLEAKQGGMGQEYVKTHSVHLPAKAYKKFNKYTTLQVVYTMDRSVIRYIDTLTGKIFKRVYVNNGKRVPYYPSAPFHEGYVFRGYTGPKPQKVLKTNQVITSKAFYEPIRYTIRYAGDYGATGFVRDQTDVKYDQVVTLRKNAFKKENYDFVGWVTDTGKRYSAGQSVKNLMNKKGIITLTAVWKESELVNYKIKYHYNGGTADNPATYTRNDSFILNNPVRHGFDFMGWTGTGINKMTKTVYIDKNSKGTRTYTANWKSRDYTVYFDANGGKGTMSPVYTNSDEKFTLPTNEFTKVRYLFAGWKDDYGNLYKDGQTVKNILYESNYTTLRAVWVVNPKANVILTINPNGGIYEGNREIRTVFGGNGQKIVLTEPVKEGYEFVEWVVKGGGSVAYEKELRGLIEITELRYTFGTADATITAKYARAK